MHELVSFNHEIIRSEDASMSPVSVSGLYGKGVFTTLAIRGGQPFLFDKHWERLANNSERLGINIESLSKDDLFASLSDLVTRNSVTNGRCRITVFDSSSSQIWRTLTDQKSSVLIQSADMRVRPDRLRLTISPFLVSSTAPLNNIKTCNYLEQTVSYDAAAREGFDEAIRLNEKHEVVSACMANVFWETDGKFYTPMLDTGCLHGTTRAFVAESIQVSPVRHHVDALKHANHVFLTSAGLGIAEVEEIRIGDETAEFGRLGEDFYDLGRLCEIRWQ
ncbi:MAG: aminotransferase class IV [Acidobacteriota bacterium]|nr:aminotransferase class IV [Acidobacteriota bacterium]